MITVAQALKEGVHLLRAPRAPRELETARLDAELLLAKVLSCSRSHLLAYPEKELTLENYQAYQALLKARAENTPLAYLTGEKEFWSLKLKVTPDVLIPRPETELLVECILNAHATKKNQTVLDLGTGSGAIALALFSAQPQWTIFACDISAAALAIAKENGRGTRVHFFLSDWFKHCPPLFKADIIVSNPPYLAEHDPHLVNTEISHEPRNALVAAEEGLAHYKTLAREAKAFLTPGGSLYFEHGEKQAAAVQAILAAEDYHTIETFDDLEKRPRVTRACEKRSTEAIYGQET